MDRDPADPRRASLRASDADREQFVEALREHHAEGRLTLEELTERTERAYAARAALLRSVLWYGLLTLVLLVVWVMSGAGYFWPILGFAMPAGLAGLQRPRAAARGPRPLSRRRGPCVQCPGDPTGPSPLGQVRFIRDASR